jgi:radical SAM protein with 4Fe4S-binding SPASM domain
MHAMSMLPRLLLAYLDYRRRSEVAHSLPIRLWVEASSTCNLQCPMCPNRKMKPGDRLLMDFELFRRIVDEARGFVGDIYLHHRGEPLLNPRLFDMIEYCRQARVRTRLHTNGTQLNEHRASRLLVAGPDLVSFSVDGFDRASYEAIRKGAVFEQTVGNILRFLELRRSMRLKRPYVVVEKIRFRRPSPTENAESIRSLKRRFEEAGVDEVIEKEEYAWAEDAAPEAQCPRTCLACTFPWYAMVICANGTVTPCPQDFWASMAMGSVRMDTLEDIWNGSAYRDLRHRFRTDLDSLPLCRKCDRLHRKTVGGVPFQYLAAFLADHLVGYGRLRKRIGTSEWN